MTATVQIGRKHFLAVSSSNVSLKVLRQLRSAGKEIFLSRTTNHRLKPPNFPDAPLVSPGGYYH